MTCPREAMAGKGSFLQALDAGVSGAAAALLVP